MAKDVRSPVNVMAFWPLLTGSKGNVTRSTGNMKPAGADVLTGVCPSGSTIVVTGSRVITEMTSFAGALVPTSSTVDGKMSIPVMSSSGQ